MTNKPASAWKAALTGASNIDTNNDKGRTNKSEAMSGESVLNPTILVGSSANTNSLQVPIYRLNGKNYMEWAQSVRLILSRKGKFGYLRGKIKKPVTGDPTEKSSKAENSLMITWLVNSMEPGIGKSFMFLPTAKEVWEAVHDTYSDLENSSQIFGMKSKLWQARQGDRDVTIFYNEMMSWWQELDLCYDDVWECPNDSARHLKREENDRVFMFLAGLDKELDEVRGRILGRKPLPSLCELFSEVRMEEGRKKIIQLAL